MSSYVDKEGRSAVPDDVHDLTDAADPRNATNMAALLNMSSEERASLDSQLEASFHDPSGAGAKYKVEVLFTKRSMHEAYIGTSIVYRNRGKLHGGGDELVYFCKAVNAAGQECDSPLDDELVSKRQSVCPKCLTAQKSSELYADRIARLTTQNWAKHLLWRMQTVGMNADLVMQYHPGDLRLHGLAMREKHGSARASDTVDRMRGDWKRIAYPLRSMVRDTANGSEVIDRIRAFLEA